MPATEATFDYAVALNWDKNRAPIATDVLCLNQTTDVATLSTGSISVKGVSIAGTLYVADQANSRVLEYDTPLSSDTVADRVFGQGGSFTSGTCNNGGVSASSLCGPRGVGLDHPGNLYVADTDNSRVLGFDKPVP